MSIFAGDYFKYNLSGFYKQDQNQLCNYINGLQQELYRARVEAYEHIQTLFNQHPNRVYKFEWPGAYEWDSDLLCECPRVSFRETTYVPKDDNMMVLTTYFQSGDLIRIYSDNGEIMVDAKWPVPLVDVVEIEVVLESILSAKDYNVGLSDYGFYYNENGA